MDSLSTEERTSWQKTGDLPDRVSVRPVAKKDVPADPSSASAETSAASSAAEPAVQAVPTGTVKESPASEPGKPEKRTGHKGNAETRLQEVLAEQRRDRAEVDRLRRELDETRRGSARPDATAASSPATPTPQAEYERYLALPNAPKEEQFDSYAKFTAAMGVFIADTRDQERSARAQVQSGLERDLQAIEDVGKSARERLQAATQADPEFISKVNPDLLEIPTLSQVRASARALHAQGKVAEATQLLKTINGANALAEEVARSEHIDRLLIHFSTDDGRAEWQRLVRLPNRDAQLRDFVRLEHRLAAGASAPAPKHVSTAPTPVTVLGTRPNDAADAVEAAVKAKDSARYSREATRRELAGLRG